MKIKMFILIIITIMLISGCMQSAVTVPSASENPAVVSSSPSPTEPAQTPNPIETTAIPSVASAPSDETLVVTDGPIPGLLGNQWYDFDKAGAYPGASVVQCGNKIAFQLLVYRGEMDYDSYLAFADPDGKHCVKTKILDPSYPNYKDGWVYLIYNHGSIYKVKTDGSGFKLVFKVQSRETQLSDLLLVEDQLYVFERINLHKKEKTIFIHMDLDGSNKEELNEFDSFGYSCAPFYDSGKLYYINGDIDNSKADLYEYDTAAGINTCLTKNLDIDYGKIAVHGDKVYHLNNAILYVYTISTKKDELFAPTKNQTINDFGFYNRWLLLTNDDDLMCYDLLTGILYLNTGLGGGSEDIVPTPNNLYLEDDEYGFIYPVTFQNGGFTVGDDFNEK